MIPTLSSLSTIGLAILTGILSSACLVEVKEARPASTATDAGQESDSAPNPDGPCANYADLVMESLPLAYYPMNDTVETNIVDKSGNKNHGRIQGDVMLAQSGAFDVGLGFSAVGVDKGFVNTPDTVNPFGGDFTIEAFVRVTGDPVQARGGIYIREEYTVSGFRFGVTDDGHVNFWCDESGCADNDLLSITTLTRNQWYHVAFTHRALDGEVQIFINGTAEARGLFTLTNPLPADAAAGFGSMQGKNMPSDFDEMAIYGSVLSQEVLASHYGFFQGNSLPVCP